MVIDHLLNLIFPSRCLACRVATKNNAAICPDCFGKIPMNQTLFCSECRARLPENKKICHQGAQFILGSAANYESDAVKDLIHGLKFQYLRAAAVPLGDLLANYVANLGLSTLNFVVIPLPLSKNRLRKRGFNQSALIAARFAERLDLPLRTDALMRAKHAKPQSETKSAAERRANVTGAFAVKNADDVTGKNVLLIDDVVTSGATLSGAASALKSAGAKTIIALTTAKV